MCVEKVRRATLHQAHPHQREEHTGRRVVAYQEVSDCRDQESRDKLRCRVRCILSISAYVGKNLPKLDMVYGFDILHVHLS